MLEHAKLTDWMEEKGKGLEKFENPCLSHEQNVRQHGESGRCVAVTKAENNSPSSEGRRSGKRQMEGKSLWDWEEKMAGFINME